MQAQAQVGALLLAPVFQCLNMDSCHGLRLCFSACMDSSACACVSVFIWILVLVLAFQCLYGHFCLHLCFSVCMDSPACACVSMFIWTLAVVLVSLVKTRPKQDTSLYMFTQR